jgi:hypothetical protein
MHGNTKQSAQNLNFDDEDAMKCDEREHFTSDKALGQVRTSALSHDSLGRFDVREAYISHCQMCMH